jgi:hypothetical protein
LPGTKGCSLVDVVEHGLPIAKPMFWLALLRCLLPATDYSALDSFETRRAARALIRHPGKTRPRPVAAEATFYRFAAH